MMETVQFRKELEGLTSINKTELKKHTFTCHVFEHMKS